MRTSPVTWRARVCARAARQVAVPRGVDPLHDVTRHTPLADAVVDLFTCVAARAFKGSYYSSFSDAIAGLRAARGTAAAHDEHDRTPPRWHRLHAGPQPPQSLHSRGDPSPRNPSPDPDAAWGAQQGVRVACLSEAPTGAVDAVEAGEGSVHRADDHTKLARHQLRTSTPRGRSLSRSGHVSSRSASELRELAAEAEEWRAPGAHLVATPQRKAAEARAASPLPLLPPHQAERVEQRWVKPRRAVLADASSEDLVEGIVHAQHVSLARCAPTGGA